MGRSFAVLGLGRFGKKLALSLYDMGEEVMAVDKNPELVEAVSEGVTYAVEADVSNADALKGINIGGMDTVVVAMGSDLTASIMAVMVSKEQGVPHVIAKAADERMGEILKKVGADRIIFPEEDTGLRIARKLSSDSFLDFFDIDDNLCLVEIKPKPEWIGKNLIELKLRDKYRMNVVAVKDHSEMRSFIDPKRPLEDDTELLVIIEKDDLKFIK
ncbi:MAG TPA: TrkA family potassium uptake protein [Lachnospiraceae bacterium]|nr:TrkA family potassium uptake protein [Lachnospiraceae bacterium]